MSGHEQADEVRDLVDGLFRAAHQIHDRLGEIAARHELTLPQAMLLRSLRLPTPMAVLADAQGCDPSNVTGLVARIERLGLVERSTDPNDRRVRLLSLTPEGTKIRDAIDDELTRDISQSFDLPPAERAELNRLLKLTVT